MRHNELIPEKAKTVFNHRLLELEAELKAKEQARRKPEQISPECYGLLQYIEKEIELRLADKVPRDWSGWISYLRNKQAMVILRGRSFKEGGMFPGYRAGADVPFGLDTITEYRRGFDVTPPQDLDHLLINFGLDGDNFKTFLWYGENISPYKLIFQADVEDAPYKELSEAVVEACIWIMKRPKHQTLEHFLRSQEEQK